MTNLTATMADLDTYNDKVIAFEAVRASDTSRLGTRQPLQPTNTQIPSSPRKFPHKPASIKPSFDSASDENGTRSNTHSLPRSPDRISLASRSHSQTSILPQSSTSDRAGGDIDMAGFARYCANYRDRVQASHPKYNEGTYIPESRMLLMFNP